MKNQSAEVPKICCDSNGELLQKGDLVEFFRGAYHHWGIYEGNGSIIHVTCEPNVQSSFVSSNVVAGSSSALSGNRSAEVRSDPLEKVANGGKLYKNNLHDVYIFSPENIIKRANKFIGKAYDYDLLMNNCEHFVCKMRYDVARSQQVETAVIDFFNLVLLIAIFVRKLKETWKKLEDIEHHRID